MNYKILCVLLIFCDCPGADAKKTSVKLYLQ